MKGCSIVILPSTNTYYICMKQKWNFRTESLELKLKKSAGGYEYFGRLRCLVTRSKKNSVFWQAFVIVPETYAAL